MGMSHSGTLADLPERNSSVSRTPYVSRGCCCPDLSVTENSTSLQPSSQCMREPHMDFPGTAVQVTMQSPVVLHLKTFCCPWWSHMPAIMPARMILPR